jgi:hypothetical protein
VLSTVGVAVALLLALALPGGLQAAASQEPRPYGFFVKGTHGFSLLAVAIPGSAEAARFELESYGSLGLYLVRGKNAEVTYAVPKAKVTATSVEADLGSLGKIDVTRVHTGRKKQVRKCGQKAQLPVDRFEGTIEFHGEEGFTEVDATGATGGDLEINFCEGEGEGAVTPGKRLPGAHLRVEQSVERGGVETSSLSLDATQARPGAKTRIGAEVMEFQGEMEIHRAFSTWAGASALRYEPRHLNGATLRDAPSLSGWGHFTRRPGSAENEPGRWAGNLTVDFPGRADVPASGPGFTASLERARR